MRTKGVLDDTDEEIRRRIRYEPETGKLFYRVTSGGRGGKAGSEMVGRIQARGYRDIGINGKRFLVHRVAWFLTHGYWPDNIDHINHDRLNNRLANLREVSNAENMLNKGVSPRNKSGVNGVDWYARDGKWRAQIGKDNERRWLGCFDTIEEAAAARQQAEAQLGFHHNHGRKVAA